MRSRTSSAPPTAAATAHDPLMTVWPALTEAMDLLGVKLLPLDHHDAPRMRELMGKYRDLQIDLADAALVRAAERDKLSRISTLDRRHFRIYRPVGLRRFIILPM